MTARDDGDKWAVILGATGGSGAAIARAVAEDPGLHVFGIHRGRHPESAAAVEAAVSQNGRRAHMHVGEAGTGEGVQAGARVIRELLGPRRVKLLVHAIANASVGRLTAAGDERLDQRRLEKTFSSMAHSFVYWVQAFLDLDVFAPEARIVGLTNPMGDAVVGGTAAIAASKAALGAYVRHLAHELGPRGYRVNVLNFGAITTQAVGKTFGPSGVEQLRSVVERATPAGRLVRPEEVGRFVSVLAGDRGGWFNGATIDFTGGEFQGLMNVLLQSQDGSR